MITLVFGLEGSGHHMINDCIDEQKFIKDNYNFPLTYHYILTERFISRYVNNHNNPLLYCYNEINIPFLNCLDNTTAPCVYNIKDYRIEKIFDDFHNSGKSIIINLSYPCYQISSYFDYVRFLLEIENYPHNKDFEINIIHLNRNDNCRFHSLLNRGYTTYESFEEQTNFGMVRMMNDILNINKLFKNINNYYINYDNTNSCEIKDIMRKCLNNEEYLNNNFVFNKKTYDNNILKTEDPFENLKKNIYNNINDLKYFTPKAEYNVIENKFYDNLTLSIIMTITKNRFEQFKTTLLTIFRQLCDINNNLNEILDINNKCLGKFKNITKKEFIEIIIVLDNYNSEDVINISNLINELEINYKLLCISNKNYDSSCLNYHYGIKESTCDLIIMQNSEVMHVGNVIEEFKQNIEFDKYIVFNVLNSIDFSMNEYIFNNFDDFKYSDHSNSFWNTHYIYNPRNLHYLVGFNKTKILQNEFICDLDFFKNPYFEDDALIFKIEKSMNFICKNIINNNIYGVHLYHLKDSNNSQYYSNKDFFNFNLILYYLKVNYFKNLNEFLDLKKSYNEEYLKILIDNCLHKLNYQDNLSNKIINSTNYVDLFSCDISKFKLFKSDYLKPIIKSITCLTINKPDRIKHMNFFSKNYLKKYEFNFFKGETPYDDTFKQYIKKHDYNINFVNCNNYNNILTVYQIACCRSFLKLMTEQYTKMNDDELIIICEDDITFYDNKDSNIFFNNIENEIKIKININDLNKKGIIIKLANQFVLNPTKQKSLNPYQKISLFEDTGITWSNACFIVNRKYIEYILLTAFDYEQVPTTADSLIHYLTYNKYNYNIISLVANPPIFDQLSLSTNINSTIESDVRPANDIIISRYNCRFIKKFHTLFLTYNVDNDSIIRSIIDEYILFNNINIENVIIQNNTFIELYGDNYFYENKIDDNNIEKTQKFFSQNKFENVFLICKDIKLYENEIKNYKNKYNNRIYNYTISYDFKSDIVENLKKYKLNIISSK